MWGMSRIILMSTGLPIPLLVILNGMIIKVSSQNFKSFDDWRTVKYTEFSSQGSRKRNNAPIKYVAIWPLLRGGLVNANRQQFCKLVIFALERRDKVLDRVMERQAMLGVKKQTLVSSNTWSISATHLMMMEISSTESDYNLMITKHLSLHQGKHTG